MTLLVKLYAQFHPSKASEDRAVVDARMNTPVRTRERVSQKRFKERGCRITCRYRQCTTTTKKRELDEVSCQ